MELDVTAIVEKVIVLGAGAIVTWFFKMRRDLDHAFRKIRDLEAWRDQYEPVGQDDAE